MRELIWNTLLTAQMNGCYWSRLASRFARREKWIKIFLAITSSGTVAGWTVWNDYAIVWKALSALSAVLAVSLPVLDYSGRVTLLNKISSKYAQLRLGYDQLWAQIDVLTPDSFNLMQAELTKKEIELSDLQVNEPDDRELLVHCQTEVLQSRGLPNV
ncbi:MAG TPA: hypothetical protein VNH19_19970 [Candidatus Limnocylindrales bacterium]|nr:hypothetical protein [Candidatus Limnocylindrales bacterium]